MGDRICVKIRDANGVSPTLYCHWAGLRALKAVHDALKVDDHCATNVIVNAVIKAMDSMYSDASYYLYRDECSEGMADWDQWTWIFDLTEKVWETTHPDFKDKKLTVDEVNKILRERRPDIAGVC